MANYINGKQLLEELKPWLKEVNKLKRAKQPQSSFPPIPEVVGEGILQIVEGLGRKSNFSGYTFLEEMVADAVLNTVAYIHNFNIKKSTNVFAYVTQIAYNSLIKRIQLEQKHVYQKDKLLTSTTFKSFVCDPDLEKMMPTKQTPNHTEFVASRQEAILKYELTLTTNQNKSCRLKRKIIKI